MAAVTSQIESNIRTLAQTKRIRVTEYFQDYDKLRSGYVTRPQFFRCIWQTLGITLSLEEEEYLAAKYDLRRNGRLKYKDFCAAIDVAFNPNDVGTDPASQTVQSLEYLGTIRSLNPLDPESETKILRLLIRMQQYYQYHGVSLQTCYGDFDKHHVGVVTDSQFYRSFPGPPDVNEEDTDLLKQKYGDPEHSGFVNYVNLHHDIIAIGQQLAKEKAPVKILETHVGHPPLELTPDPSLNQIFDKMRVAVYKNGIRTTEFFKDHDKLRSGIITENQFVCGLTLAVGKEAQLTEAEKQKVVEYYRAPDGRVRYKELCDLMENAFTVSDLEKKPTQSVVRPPKGALSRTLQLLSPKEEEKVNAVLHHMSETVRRRRLLVYPYFKDYDRGHAYTRVITPTQFARILHFLSLNVGEQELSLLCKKFKDPSSGDINYPAFVQAVDQEFVGHTIDEAEFRDKGRTNAPVPENRVAESEVSYEDLMARIRHIVITNSLRLLEYFEDYDPLRSGSISKTQFRRGMSSLGMSKLGQHDLTDGQFKLLCDVYQNPKQDDQMMWKHFMVDIESVIAHPNLEIHPMYKVPPTGMFTTPKPGTLDWAGASEDHRALFDHTMDRLRKRASERRILTKPVFQDFDKNNNGHVSVSQFRQCLNMLELQTTEEEKAAVEAKYCNDTGFNYIAFLSELQPQETPQLMYLQRLETLRLTNQKKALPELNPAMDLEGVLLKLKTKVRNNPTMDVEGVLLKLKTKVAKERICILEFMRDYDKLRSGRMLKTSFRRALDLCRFELKKSEVEILEDRYQSLDPDYVEYVRFSDEIESIFTNKDLEKAPLLEPSQFQPPRDCTFNKLQPDDEEKFIACMKRLAEKVRIGQIQLFPLFEDYDRVNNGSVSRSQFRRVLTELELGSMVGQREFELLWCMFEVMIGGKNDVNYITFCDKINELAKFDKRKP